MKTWIRISVVLSAVLVLSGTVLPAQDARSRPDRAEQVKRLVGAAWWNDLAKIKALGLTAEQRTKMNGELTAFADAVIGSTSQKEATANLNDALVAGSWDTARELAKELATGSAERMLQRSDLKIAIMSLMTGEQRHQFAEKYPRLFERQWPVPPASKKRKNTNAQRESGVKEG